MICTLQHVKSGTDTQKRDNWSEQSWLREVIPTSLNEQHGDPHLLKVRSAFRARSARGMQRERQEHQSADPWQRSLCLRLRSHASAKRPAPRDERQIRCQACGLRNGSTNRRVTQRGRIRPLAPFLPVGELITQRGDAALGEPGCNGLHRRMLHSRAGPVRQNEEGACVGRAVEQRRDALVRTDIEGQALASHQSPRTESTFSASRQRAQRARNGLLSRVSPASSVQ